MCLSSSPESIISQGLVTRVDVCRKPRLKDAMLAGQGLCSAVVQANLAVTVEGQPSLQKVWGPSELNLYPGLNCAEYPFLPHMLINGGLRYLYHLRFLHRPGSTGIQCMDDN